MSILKVHAPTLIYNLPEVELRLSRMVTIDMGDDGTSSACFPAKKKLIVEIIGSFLSSI